MHRSWPLHATNPELSILEFPGYCEYRVENWRLARNGSGKVIKGTSRLTWWDAFLCAAMAVIWRKVHDSSWALGGLAALLLLHIWVKCTQVLHESVIILPPHGIQLETHRGFPSLPLFVTRRFIPLVTLYDVIINEGLKGWDVHYYLAAVKQIGPKSFALDVAYENLLPHHIALARVYRGVHKLLLSARDASPIPIT